MRYIVNSKNYVIAVGFGSEIIFANSNCTEYTGGIPSGWASLEEWYEEEGEKLWRWKIVNGNLTLDSSAVAPEEGRWGVPKLQNKTVTPSASTKKITADSDYDGLETVTVNGDSDLIPANIKSGVNIFGVAGSFSPSNGKSVEIPISNGYAFNLLSLTGLGMADNTPPKRIIGFCMGMTGIQSFLILRLSSDNWGGYLYVDGTYTMDINMTVSCSGGDIIFAPSVGSFPAGNYNVHAVAYWE